MVEEDGGAVGGDFYDVFGGVGVGFFEVCDYGFVERFSCVVKDFGEAGLGGGERVAELQEGFGDGAGGGAGEADDANAAAARWGGDGDDGVFKFRHVEFSAGFSYGNGRKKCWRGGGVFLQGVLRKVGCRTWFFDGEIVVDSVVKRGEKSPRFRCVKFHVLKIFLWKRLL